MNRNEGLNAATKEAEKLGCSFIMLGHGKWALVDNSDFVRVSKHKWRIHSGGYVIAHVPKDRNRNMYLHRFILGLPDGIPVDHKSGVKLDNRRCNIRAASVRLNQANKKRKANRDIPYKGVRFVNRNPNKKWVARLIDKGVEHYLGAFDTAIQAAKAYDHFAIKTWGEFARPNFAL